MSLSLTVASLPALFFDVIEFWIENRLRLEVVARKMARRCEEIMQFARLDAMMAAE
jgi:hypothetical protein